MPLLQTVLPLMLLAATQDSAVPPPAEQVAADCAAPTYASDRLVCDDSALLALDAQMRITWEKVDMAATVVPNAWVEAQGSWFRRRSLCAFAEPHRACLQAAYLERIAVLERLLAASSHPPGPSSAAVCDGAPWGDRPVLVSVVAAGALTIQDGAGRVIAAATPASTEASWRPHVGFSTDGRTVRLLPIVGVVVSCRWVGAR